MKGGYLIVIDPLSDERPTTFKERAGKGWHDPVEAPLVVRPGGAPQKAKRIRRKMLLAGVTIVAACLTWLAWPANDALGATEGGPWNVKMASASTRSMVVLVYGKEAGLHLLRVPGSSGGTAPAALSANMGQSLYVMSLGRSPLEVSADSPPDQQPVSWNARGRLIKAFRNEQGTGVRVW